MNAMNQHWYLILARMQEFSIEVMDSMGGGDKTVVQAVLKYIMKEHEDKKGAPFPDADKWTLEPESPEWLPRQRDSKYISLMLDIS